jgi:cytochrome bd ubiquinol oxidase subunit II
MSLADFWFLLFVAVIAAYIVLDGFDLGVGMLHPFVAKEDRERRIVLNSIGPIWDGNEVWLVVGGGVLFAAFPVVYAAMFSGFYWALMLVLIALILRTVAIEFRGKRESSRWRGLWDSIFSASSFGLALLLGVAFGNVVTGVPLDKNGEVQIGSLLELLHPFVLFLGVTTVAMLLMHGAHYLVVKTEGDLQARVRRWVPRFIALFTLTAAISAVWIAVGDYGVTDTFTDDVWTIVFPLGALVAYVLMIVMARRGRDTVAFFGSSAVIAFSLATISAGLYPNLLKSSTDPAYSMTVSNASADHYTLTVMLVVAIIGIPFVLLYTAGVQYLFSGKVKLTPSSY